ncbi:hypothetical protein [Trinickia mobilis]|uniref:hypothetical protein n=1 Tax=Trinickia mobilis TaxID=2816356 RepID=UPI001A8F73C8|nr:hypothetical protein [Trinickia mobilis]
MEIGTLRQNADPQARAVLLELIDAEQRLIGSLSMLQRAQTNRQLLDEDDA